MMKTLRFSMWMVLVAGVGFSTVMLLTRSPRMHTTEANESLVDQPAPAAPVPVRELASVVPSSPAKPGLPVVEIASPSADVVRIRADQTLAKVNEQAILLQHLVPLPPDEQEQAMTSEEYESRLNRAIEMELTFQAAATRGVDLTPEQTKRVEDVARRHEATLQEYGKQGFTWSSLTPAQVQFEQRLTTALLLQQNLVAREVDVKPSPDAATQARYEDVLRGLMVRLKASGNIGALKSAL